MASPEIHHGSPEKKGVSSKELKKLSPEMKHLSSAEREALERDLAEKGEKAEKVIESHKHEKEPIIKGEESHQEKSKSAGESASQRLAHRPKPKTDQEKSSVYKNELKQIQSKMPIVQRTFSRVIHNSSVEKITDVTQVTVFRPSAMIGASVFGLILGLAIYLVARINNYSLGNLEILALAIFGALFGILIEFITRRIKPKK